MKKKLLEIIRLQNIVNTQTDRYTDAHGPKYIISHHVGGD